MKNSLLTLFISVVIILLATNGCDKSETPEPDANGGQFTVFTNQTGVANSDANGLQAQYVIEDDNGVVDFYGSFDSDGNPEQVSNIRVEMTSTDTIVNFLIDEQTGKFSMAVLEVAGERLPSIIEFSYPSGDASLVMALYDHDWSSGDSELLFSAEYTIVDGVVVENPTYVSSGKYDEAYSDGLWGVLSLGVGVAVAEAAVVGEFVVGTSAVGAASPVLAGVFAAAGTVIVAAVVVGAALASISNAGASELDPQSTTLPPGTPPNNPVPPTDPPVLPPNPCISSGISVSVGVDPGNEVVAIATGGTGGPYTFNWSTGASGSASTYHSIIATYSGVHSVLVTDANGCSASGSVNVTVESVCTFCGADEMISYSWNSGESSMCITVDEPGTYVVNMVDTGLVNPPPMSFVVTSDGVGGLVCP